MCCTASSAPGEKGLQAVFCGRLC